MTLHCLTTPRTFNTGRHYAADGQPIVYRLVEYKLHPDREKWSPLTPLRWVIFEDRARYIDGAIPYFPGNLDFLTDRWVLAHYDSGTYRSLTLEERDILRPIPDTIR